MNKLGLILCAILVWQIAAWAFAPARQPETPKAPQRDTRDFGPNEKYLVEGREKQRESAIRALEMPWGSRCSGDDRKQFISGLNYYYYHRNNQMRAYPENFGEAGAGYITAQWSTADDRRIDRLTQDAYARGYLRPSDFRSGAEKLVATVVKDERVTGKGCQG